MKNALNIYRPEIDGLRAVAIMSVLFYHAGLGCPGGFVGVDVFFVISGFLIGGILLRELDAGKFSFAKFWERRVRRIVPAILVFLAATLFVGWRILPASNFVSLGEQTVFALLGLANFKMLALTGGYWAMSAQSLLLLHTWSLAVEEQFYVLMPVILALVHRLSPRKIFSVILGLLLTSLALSLIWEAEGYAGNFYLLPSRAWELLLGCLGAWMLERKITPPKRWAEFTAAAGLLGIVVSAAIFHLNVAWPDARALLPVLGAFLILISPGASWPAQLLSLPPLRFIGLISYSLYLWHWPMVVILQNFGPDYPTLADRWLLVAGAVVLGALSWRFVEQPFRNKLPRWRIPTKPLLIGAGVAWVCLIIMAGALAKSPPQRIASSSVPAVFNSPGMESIEKYDAARREAKGGLVLNDAGSRPDCVVLGSSLGMALGPVIESLAHDYHVPCVSFCRSGVSPLFSGSKTPPPSVHRFYNALERDAAVKKYIAEWKPRLVIIVAKWNSEWDDRAQYPAASPLSFVEESSNTLAWLGQHAERVVVVGQNPQLPLQNTEDVRVAVLRRYRAQGDVMPRLLEHPAETEKRHRALEIFRGFGLTNVTILDPDPLFLNANGSVRYYDSNGFFYCDDHHLNSIGSLRLKPLLEPFFREIRHGAASR